jgi:hypothetical protein
VVTLVFPVGLVIAAFLVFQAGPVIAALADSPALAVIQVFQAIRV